jgi:hypothetical protein
LTHDLQDAANLELVSTGKQAQANRMEAQFNTLLHFLQCALVNSGREERLD